MMKHPALIYRQFSVQGATPLGLVVMLYDGAIAFMHRAVAAMEAHDIQKKCNHLNRALAIIVQLEGSLNFEQGGEVAQTLKSFYVYSRAQALKANIENSPEILRSLIEKFATVREAWHEAEHPPPPSPTTSASEGSPDAPSPTLKASSWRLTG
jgi:flagellar protein FliS